eukprot:Skav216717  [mRNA]  locus=scaffold91:727296:728045:- [translate_table: standard]
MESFWNFKLDVSWNPILLHLLLALLICLLAAFAAIALRFRKRDVGKSSIAQDVPKEPKQCHFCHDKSQLVIFDFDRVLTTEEVWCTEEMDGAPTASAFSGTFSLLKKALFRPLGRGAFGDEQRLVQLQTFLQELSELANLCIVSRNSRKVIQTSLESAELPYFFSILGAEDFEDMAPKSKVVGDLVSFYTVKAEDVLFIDDMFLNVSDVSQHCHVATFHIRKLGGMDCWDCEYILAWARSRHADSVDSA